MCFSAVPKGKIPSVLGYACVVVMAFGTWQNLTAQVVDPNDDYVVINEIEYDPQGVDNRNWSEWVELHNTHQTASVDLSGYIFEASGDPDGPGAGAAAFVQSRTLPANTIIPPNGYLVLAARKDVLMGNHAFVDPDEVVDLAYPADSSYLVNNPGGKVALIAPGETAPVDQVNFLNAAPWPLANSNNQLTIELNDPILDNDAGGNWSISTHNRGTPGAVNSAYWSTSAVTVEVDGVGGATNKFKSLSEAVEFTNRYTGGSTINVMINNSPAADNGRRIRITNPVVINGDGNGDGTPCDILVDVPAIQRDVSRSFIEICSEGNVTIRDLKIHPNVNGSATQIVNGLSTEHPLQGTGNYLIQNVAISGSDSANNYLDPRTTQDLYYLSGVRRWYGYLADGGVFNITNTNAGESNVTLENCIGALARSRVLNIKKAKTGTTVVKGGLFAHAGEDAVVCDGAKNVTIEGTESERVQVFLANRAGGSAHGLRVVVPATVDRLAYIDSYGHSIGGKCFALGSGIVTLMEYCRAWNTSASNPGAPIYVGGSGSSMTITKSTFHAINAPAECDPGHGGMLSFTDCIFTSENNGQIILTGGTYTFANCAMPTDGESQESLNVTAPRTAVSGSGTVTLTLPVTESPMYADVMVNSADPGDYQISDLSNINWLRPTNGAAYNGKASGDGNLTGGAAGVYAPVSLSGFTLD